MKHLKPTNLVWLNYSSTQKLVKVHWKVISSILHGFFFRLSNESWSRKDWSIFELKFLHHFCTLILFQTLNTENERYRDVYDDVLEIALEITQLKNNYNITKIAWLFDSALSSVYAQKEIKNTDKLENGHNIFHFEILLLQALVLIINSQMNYFIQYDEQSAWYNFFLIWNVVVLK